MSFPVQNAAFLYASNSIRDTSAILDWLSGPKLLSRWRYNCHKVSSVSQVSPMTNPTPQLSPISEIRSQVIEFVKPNCQCKMCPCNKPKIERRQKLPFDPQMAFFRSRKLLFEKALIPFRRWTEKQARMYRIDDENCFPHDFIQERLI